MLKVPTSAFTIKHKSAFNVVQPGHCETLQIILASSNTDTVHCAGLVSGLVQGRAGTITRVTGLVVPRDTVALVSILYLQTLTHGNQVIWSWILHWRLVPMSGFLYFDSVLRSHSHYLLQCSFFSRLSGINDTFKRKTELAPNFCPCETRP